MMRKAAFVLALGLLVYGCTSEPVAPSVVAPSPSPIAGACPQTGYLIQAHGFVDDFRVNEYVTVSAVPSSGNTPLDAAACAPNYARLLNWSFFPLWCSQFQNVQAISTDLQCYIAGVEQVKVCAADDPKLCGARNFNVLP